MVTQIGGPSKATPSAPHQEQAAQSLRWRSSTMRKPQQQQQRQRSTLADNLGSSAATKNVVVLGGSYGGMHAASVLANRLPPTHRVILIERNSHFNHLYVFPRFSSLPGHEHKAFIPYSSIFKDAPKRRVGPVAGPSSSKADGNLESPKGVAEKKSSLSNQSSSGPTNKSSEQMLGMGSIGGGSLRSKTSTSSDGSNSSRGDRESRNDSSLSRSSSIDGDSLFDSRYGRHLRADQSAATASSPTSSSASSLSRSESSERLNSDDDEEARAGKLAASRGVGEAIGVDGVAARDEERLGRPEMEIEDLSSAVEKGIDLEGAPIDAEEDGPGAEVAQGFEDSSPHIVLQANVSNITPTHIVVQSVDTSTANGKRQLWSIDSVSIPYTHMVYALGSHLPDPLRTEARTKQVGVSWMRDTQNRIEASDEIVLVGGGALGVEFASDIKSIHPEKSVTLIHSRKQLLPNFDEQVHEIAFKRLQELGVNLVLGERLALHEGCPRGSTVQRGEAGKIKLQPKIDETNVFTGGRKRVVTTGGKVFECDLLLLCTGQQPNTELMAQLSPTSVDSSTRLIRVLHSLQVKVPDPNSSLAQMPFDARPPCGDCDCFLDKKAAGADVDDSAPHEHDHDTCLSNVFAIGDCVDAFGALNAGYQAWAMADVAAENIVRDIENGSGNVPAMTTAAEEPANAAAATSASDKPASAPELQQFHPAPHMLKLSLGVGKMVYQGAPDEKTGRPSVDVREDPADLSVEGVWTFMAGMSTEDMYL